MTVPANRVIVTKGSKRTALSIAVIVIVAAAMYNWVLSPQVGYLRAVQRYRPVVNEMVEKTGKIGKTLDEKRRQLRTLQRELAETHDRFFTREEARTFLGNLQSFVEQTGCKVAAADLTSDGRTGQPRESKELASVVTSQVDLTAVGQYDQIIALLERLQGNRRRIRVDSCGLKLSDMRSGRLECKLILILHALSDKEGLFDE
jgi:hypothetical protein